MDADAPLVFPGTPFGPSRNPAPSRAPRERGRGREHGTRDPGRTRRRSRERQRFYARARRPNATSPRSGTEWEGGVAGLLLFLSQHFMQKWDDDRQIFMHCSPDNFCVDPKILVC
jgi:hypothetical protein